MNTLKNRSSALRPEQLGAINTATVNAFNRAVELFEATPEAKSLSKKQHAKALKLIAAKVTIAMNEFAAALNW